MSEQLDSPLEERARSLFHDSVEGVDFALRSRLTQARAAALAAAEHRRPWLFRPSTWAPAAGVTAAAVLGVALWFGAPITNQSSAVADNQSNFEDMELVASTDENSADAVEMLQDDIDFYDFADKAAG
jgi:negative regulator of sigma E activity